ncbi:hypothetical protein [Psychroserpens mesophilus]|uniref:hypothetical protein n=1 Tax=Psychroserpens mesophilus TaxID=325473 RepID=UPI003D645C79
MRQLFLFAMALAVFSCSSDDSSEDDGMLPEGSNGTLIKTVKKVSAGGVVEEQFDYEYNALGNITKLTSVTIYGQTITTFQYDANDILLSFTEVKTDPFNDVRTEIDYIEYDNGVIIGICQDITYDNETSSFDDPEVDKIEFEYNASQYVSMFTHYWQADADFNTCNDLSSVSNTEDLEYDANGNMVRYENSDYFFTPSYLTYAYDDKNHPYANVKPEVFRKLYGFSTINNISSANEYNADTDELIGTIAYSYVFNSNNYPTVLERTYTDDNGNFGQTARYEYTYY